MNNLPPAITEISLVPISPREDGLVAFVSLTFDGRIRCNNIAVYTDIKNGGFRLCYPKRELVTGKKTYLFYPINKETGDIMTEAVSVELEKLISSNIKKF